MFSYFSLSSLLEQKKERLKQPDTKAVECRKSCNIVSRAEGIQKYLMHNLWCRYYNEDYRALAYGQRIDNQLQKRDYLVVTGKKCSRLDRRNI